MPRIAITVSLVDDENRTLSSQNWSPLGYQDLGNPSLYAIEATLVNGAERNLLERLRTSIDRTLLTFARRERRRFLVREAAPNLDIQPVFEENDEIFRQEYMGSFSEPEPIEDPEFEHIGDIARDRSRLLIPVVRITEEQRTELLAAPPLVEEQRERPVKARTRKVKRVSRYKRDPVI